MDPSARPSSLLLPDSPNVEIDLPEALALMKKGTLFEFFEEHTVDWKVPTRATKVVELDPLEHTLILKSPDSPTRVIPLAHTTDVRQRPFDDETKNGQLDSSKNDTNTAVKELPCYLGIAYYPAGCPNMKDAAVLSLIAPDTYAAVAWRTGLAHLIPQHYAYSARYVPLDERIERAYSEISAYADVRQQIPIKYLRKVVKGRQLDALTDAIKIFQEVLQRELIDSPAHKIFDDLCKGKHKAPNVGLDADDICEFLGKIQRDPRANEVLDPMPDKESSIKFIRDLRDDADLISDPTLDKAHFCRYLYSETNDVITEGHRDLYEDMDFPLAAYFIASSHNTYLTGSQLNSKSTCEIYRQSLLSGCRCLEIDIWNGQSCNGRDEPVVTHGPIGLTFCTQILFRDVIQAIRDTAFVYSDYPVILSFENHCNETMQEVMSHFTRQIFGDLLCDKYMPNDGPDTVGPNKSLPSPAQLKRKIIIKNKRQKSLVKQVNPQKKGETFDMDDNNIDVEVEGETIKETEEEKKERESRGKVISKFMSDIVNYVWPVSFKGFHVAAATQNCYHMSSFNENKGLKFVSACPEAFASYTQRQFARIYPKGGRTSSTNYNPMLFWQIGAQLVALNYQTMDTFMMQYQIGMFSPNAACGYVLKPNCMRGHYRESRPVHAWDGFKDFTPFTDLGIDQVVQWQLSVSVLAAPCVGGTNPQVFVSIGGIPADDTSAKPFHTRPFRRKLPIPTWSADNTVTYTKLILPDLALLRIDVKDHNHSLGWEVLRLQEIRPGYHVVPLRHAESPLAHVVLKIHIELGSGEHADFADRLANPTDYSGSAGKMKAMEHMIADDEDESPGELRPSDLRPQGVDPLPSIGSGKDDESSSPGGQPTVNATSGATAPTSESTSALETGLQDFFELTAKIQQEGIHPDAPQNIYLVHSSRDIMTKVLTKRHDHFIGARQKVTKDFEKGKAAIVAAFKKSARGVYKNKMKGKKAKESADDLAAGIHAEMIELEIKMKDELQQAWQTFMKVLHPLVIRQEMELGKLKLKELVRLQNEEGRKIDKALEIAIDDALSRGKREFLTEQGGTGKTKKELKAEWDMIEQRFYKDIKQRWEGAKGVIMNAHMDQKSTLENEVKEALKELKSFQQRDSSVIQKQYEVEVGLLKNLSTNLTKVVRWDRITPDEYFAQLADEKRI